VAGKVDETIALFTNCRLKQAGDFVILTSIASIVNYKYYQMNSSVQVAGTVSQLSNRLFEAETCERSTGGDNLSKILIKQGAKKALRHERYNSNLALIACILNFKLKASFFLLSLNCFYLFSPTAHITVAQRL